MTVNLVIGVIACVLGVGLLAGNTYLMRKMFEGQQEQLQNPLHRSMWEYVQSHVPRWMGTNRFRRIFIRIWLLVIAASMITVGVRLTLLGT